MTNTLLQQVIRRMERRQVVVSPAFTPPTLQRPVKRSTGTDPIPQEPIPQVPDLVGEIVRNQTQDTDFKELGTALIRRYGTNPTYNPNGTFVLSKIWNKLKQMHIEGLSLEHVIGQNAHMWFLENYETARRLL
jgi:hypothetical protein